MNCEVVSYIIKNWLIAIYRFKRVLVTYNHFIGLWSKMVCAILISQILVSQFRNFGVALVIAIIKWILRAGVWYRVDICVVYLLWPNLHISENNLFYNYSFDASPATTILSEFPIAAPDGKLHKIAIKPVNLVSIISILWRDWKVQAAHLGISVQLV